MKIIQLYGHLNKFLYDDDSNLTVEQQQALSMGAVLSWSNSYPINTFQMGAVRPFQESETQSRDSLKKWWGISNKEEALEVLDALLHKGHKSVWSDVLEGLKTGVETTEKSHVQKLRASIPALIEQGIIEKEQDLYELDIEAWDYGRVVLVARNSYFLGYISEEQGWFYIMNAFRQVKQTYRTWLDFAKSYLIGRYMWGGLDAEEKKLNLVNAKMFEWDDSIWNRYPLNEPHSTEHIQSHKKFIRQMYAHNLTWSEKLLQHWGTFFIAAVLFALFGVFEFMEISAYERGEVAKLSLGKLGFIYQHTGKYGVLALNLLFASLFAWMVWVKKAKKIWLVPLK